MNTLGDLRTDKDQNYEFADDVVASMVQLISNPALGVETLENSAGWTAQYTITITKCMAETADTWFLSKSLPRTVIYGILVNTVHEYIMDNQEKHKIRVFWAELHSKVRQLWDKAREIVNNIKPGDKINIDEYHEMFRSELDVGTQ
jgi:hypothetical protein